MALDLGTLTAKLKADNAGLTRGLKDGRRELKDFADDGGRDIEDGFKGSGRRSAGSMVGAITSGMSRLAPAIMPVLGIVGIAGGALLGAGIAAAAIAAVPLALGGGVLAAGIMVAAKDPAVAAAFAPLKAQATQALAKFAEPFKGPLIRAATTFAAALAKATPYLVQMGVAVAPIIDQLAPALAQMAVSALPGILRAVQASVPLFTSLIKMLPNLGAGISLVVGGIAALVPWAMRVGGLFLAIGGYIGRNVIPPLRELAGAWLAEARRQFSGVAASIKANEPQLRTFVRWVGQAVSWVSAHLVPVLKSQLVGSLRAAGSAFKVVITIISGTVRAVQLIIGATQRTAGAVRTGTGQIRSYFANLPGQIMGPINGLAGRMYSAGRNAVSMLASGIRDAAGAAIARMRSLVGSLSSLIPGSPVKAGPLRVLNNGRAGRLIAGMLAAGITSGAGGARNALSSALEMPAGARLRNTRNAATASGSGADTLTAKWVGSNSNGLVRELLKSLRLELRKESMAGVLG